MTLAHAAQIGLLVMCLSTAWAGAAYAQEEFPPDAGMVDTGVVTDGDAHTGTAAGIDIDGVQVALKDDVYYLDAGIDYRLGRQLLEALDRGIVLPILLEIEILRERSYLWDETVTTLQQRYELDYHALTRQYVIRNINIGTQTAYPTLQAAIAGLGRVVDLPVIDAGLLDRNGVYSGRLQARIDTNALPVPLRLRALVSPGWALGSGWHEWHF